MATMRCDHGGDLFWDHELAQTRCCTCRAPVPLVKKSVASVSRIKRRHPISNGQYYDHYGYPIRPGKYNRGSVTEPD